MWLSRSVRERERGGLVRQKIAFFKIVIGMRLKYFFFKFTGEKGSVVCIISYRYKAYITFQTEMHASARFKQCQNDNFINCIVPSFAK